MAITAQEASGLGSFINSTRPIVQRALNARTACNRVVGEDGDEIRVGHDVMRADSSDGLQMEVVKIEGNKVYFRDPTKGLCWEMAHDLIAVNSRTACNKSWDLKVGDKVRFEGHPYGREYTVTELVGDEGCRIDGDPTVYRKSAFIAKNSAAVNRGNYQLEGAIQNISNALSMSEDAASAFKQYPDIVKKIEDARRILIDARKVAVSVVKGIR